MGETCSQYGKSRGACRDFGGKAERQRLLGRPSLEGTVILSWTSMKWDGEH